MNKRHILGAATVLALTPFAMGAQSTSTLHTNALQIRATHANINQSTEADLESQALKALQQKNISSATFIIFPPFSKKNTARYQVAILSGVNERDGEVFCFDTDSKSVYGRLLQTAKNGLKPNQLNSLALDVYHEANVEMSPPGNGEALGLVEPGSYGELLAKTAKFQHAKDGTSTISQIFNVGYAVNAVKSAASMAFKKYDKVVPKG